MQRGHKQTGFTIVELLIVIVVIAVLAAITAVAFQGLRDRSLESSIRADLTNTAKLMELAKIDGGSDTYPSTLPAGTRASNNVVLQLTATSDASTFCINAYGSESTRMSYHSQLKVRNYLCDGATIGSPVGGSVPAVPTNTNLVADFSAWTLTGTMTYNSATNEIVCGSSTGRASSPLTRVDGANNTRLQLEIYPISSSPTFSPDGGILTGSSYYASDGVTAAQSSSTPSYTGNGNAQRGAINTWTSYTWTVQTGPAVIYVRYRVDCSHTNYTSPGVRIRNPRIMAV